MQMNSSTHYQLTGWFPGRHGAGKPQPALMREVFGVVAWEWHRMRSRNLTAVSILADPGSQLDRRWRRLWRSLQEIKPVQSKDINRSII